RVATPGPVAWPTKGSDAQSAYALTRQIPEQAPDEWTPEHLEARQRRLARLAVHVWRLDY
ncbi:MAG: hypothetical protein AB1758_18660, partial [Candidatus Eremiobacterota bacterium]